MYDLCIHRLRARAHLTRTKTHRSASYYPELRKFPHTEDPPQFQRRGIESLLQFMPGSGQQVSFRAIGRCNAIASYASVHLPVRGAYVQAALSRSPGRHRGRRVRLKRRRPDLRVVRRVSARVS